MENCKKYKQMDPTVEPWGTLESIENGKDNFPNARIEAGLHVIVPSIVLQ
jgi:hypothetical protein